MLMLAPLIYVAKAYFYEPKTKLISKVIFEAMSNTLTILFFVGVFTVLIASSVAWIISVYDFKGRRFFRSIFILSFAFPPYIMAQCYGDLFSFTGFFSSFLRNNYDIRFTVDFLNIRGAIFVFVISLFPYILMFCMSFYSGKVSSYVENARLLGARGLGLFFKIGFPIARIPILTGLSLVLMETISDFGVVEYYGIPAFTTVFYKIWIARSDFGSALRLAAILMVVVFLLVWMEKYMRKNKKYSVSAKSDRFKRVPLSKKGSWFVYIYFAGLSLVTFVLPLFQLLYNSHFAASDVLDTSYIGIIASTIFVCAISSIITCIGAFLIVNFATNMRTRGANLVRAVATIGYSIPGIVIGIAVMFSLHDLDRLLSPLYLKFLNVKTIWVLSGSVFALFFAYSVRFMAIGFNQFSSGRAKISPEIFEASRVLGKNQFGTILHVELPLLKETGIMAFLLVFLEVLKELPITLLLKPMGLNTLTIQVNKYHVNEMVREASVPSLFIVLIGAIVLVGVEILNRRKYVRN